MPFASLSRADSTLFAPPIIGRACHRLRLTRYDRFMATIRHKRDGPKAQKIDISLRHMKTHVLDSALHRLSVVGRLCAAPQPSLVCADTHRAAPGL